MLGRIYHIIVAVCAVTLLCAIVFGGLFVVIQGLVAEFVGVGMWTPIAGALAPLGADLAEPERVVWSLTTELAELLWEQSTALLEGGEVPPPAGGDGGGQD